MSFLKAIWKNQGKHKKLGDEWELASEPEEETGCLPQVEIVDNETFKVKYLGKTPLMLPTNNQTTSNAITTILALAKANNRKPQRVDVNLSMKGIEVLDRATQNNIVEISIFRISNCSADAIHSRVFAFQATNCHETTECHAFLCPKRGIAEQMAIKIAKCFNAVYESWQEKNFIPNFIMESSTDIVPGQFKNGFKLLNTEDIKTDNGNINRNNIQSINTSIEKCKENWVSFENEQEETPTRSYYNINKVILASVQPNSLNEHQINNNQNWKDKNFIDLFAL
uniref:PID domain-containing protein n=1 Tax=Clastoptera arizonana TaxID=38151 RepID=A0A1B6DA83_9HEMI